MATVTEVRAGALRMLGIIEVGASASSADDTYMTQKYNEVYADLRNTGMDYWASAGPVPDEYVPHVEALMAYVSTDDYSVSDQRLQRIVRKAGVAKREIQRLGTPPYESLDNPKDY